MRGVATALIRKSCGASSEGSTNAIADRSDSTAKQRNDRSALDALDVCMESGDRWPTMCILETDFEAWKYRNGARLLWRRDVGQPVRSVGEDAPSSRHNSGPCPNLLRDP